MCSSDLYNLEIAAKVVNFLKGDLPELPIHNAIAEIIIGNTSDGTSEKSMILMPLWLSETANSFINIFSNQP